MSLYHLQKLLYELNRDNRLYERYQEDREVIFADFDLSDEELAALRADDIGMLYILGVNGQILMHYAAMCGLSWPEYIQSMRDAVDQHGNVRAGIYTMIDAKGAV